VESSHIVSPEVMNSPSVLAQDLDPGATRQYIANEHLARTQGDHFWREPGLFYELSIELIRKRKWIYLKDKWNQSKTGNRAKCPYGGIGVLADQHAEPQKDKYYTEQDHKIADCAVVEYKTPIRLRESDYGSSALRDRRDKHYRQEG
jgi:hypothetical protein